MSELASGLRKLGVVLDSQEMIAFRDTIDEDGDFLVSYVEFTSSVRRRRDIVKRNRHPASQAWYALMTMASGKDPAEWQGSMARMFEEFDRNGDGALDAQEVSWTCPLGLALLDLPSWTCPLGLSNLLDKLPPLFASP